MAKKKSNPAQEESAKTVAVEEAMSIPPPDPYGDVKPGDVEERLRSLGHWRQDRNPLGNALACVDRARALLKKNGIKFSAA